jgi:AGCS family alanine or glycine:cation symporter
MGSSGGIDQAIDRAITPIATSISEIVFYSVTVGGTEVPLVVAWLVAGALFTTFYFGFINIRGLGHALRLVRGLYDKPGQPGEVSHFQALTAALSGTVGIGNIANVAVAISIGGPGVTFWMILAGFLAMSLKLAECTLGVKYRRENPDGSVSGGPMYYLRRGFADLGWVRTGKVMGGFYAATMVVTCLGSANMFQSNQAYAQFVQVTGGTAGSWFADKGWLFGIVMAACVGAVTIGGIKSIGRFTEKVVPFMALLYVGAALVVIAMNFDALPFAVKAIITGAFTPQGVTGGAIGVAVMGFQRAVFSNEAGVGSAAIAHSAVRTSEPMSEGLVALLEPLIDTVIICTITALVITTTLYHHPELSQVDGGIRMTSTAFASRISWAPYLVTVAALLFAFSTIVTWSYYGLKGWTYLLGEGRRTTISFMAIYCGFVALGSTIQLRNVLAFSDAMMFLACAPNVLGIYLLAPTIKRELKSYFRRVAAAEGTRPTPAAARAGQTQSTPTTPARSKATD